MSVRTVVTRGYGSGGGIAVIVTRGYDQATPAPTQTPGILRQTVIAAPRKKKFAPIKAGWSDEDWLLIGAGAMEYYEI